MELAYDADDRTITIRSSPPPRTDYYLVREYGRGRRMRLVSAIRLLKRHDVKIEQTLIFRRPKLTDCNGEPLIVLQLDKARPL